MDIFIAVCLLFLEPLLFFVLSFASGYVKDKYPYDEEAKRYKPFLVFYCKYLVKRTPLQQKNRKMWNYSFNKLEYGLFKISIVGFLISIPIFLLYIFFLRKFVLLFYRLYLVIGFIFFIGLFIPMGILSYKAQYADLIKMENDS